MQRALFFQSIALTISCVLHDMVSQVCVMNSARLCIWISLGETRIAFFPAIGFIFLLRISPQAKKLLIAFKIAAMCTTSPLTFILRGCWRVCTVSADMCFVIAPPLTIAKVNTIQELPTLVALKLVIFIRTLFLFTAGLACNFM